MTESARSPLEVDLDDVADTTVTVVEHLLPTPRSVLGTKNTTQEHARRQVERHGYKARLEEAIALLATPRVASGRTGRSAAVRQDSMSGPSLEQCIEIARGELPREFKTWEELPPSWHGASTNPPSGAGSAFSDDQLPLLLSGDEELSA